MPRTIVFSPYTRSIYAPLHNAKHLPRGSEDIVAPSDCIAFERCPQDGQASADSVGMADLTYSCSGYPGCHHLQHGLFKSVQDLGIAEALPPAPLLLLPVPLATHTVQSYG